MNTRQKIVKRLFDLLVVIPLLILLTPVLLMISLAVLLQDAWPIFYSRHRINGHGKRYWLHEFRSMYKSVPPLEPKIVHLSDGSVRHDWPEMTDVDPRIMPIGGILRKTGLNRLPYLWNVFKGDISLVGIRPRGFELSMYERDNIEMPSGITGLWRVDKADLFDFEHSMDLDKEYAENYSFWLDVKILYLTILQIFHKK